MTSRIDYCTMCGNCDIACPENVSVFTLNAYSKARHIELNGSNFRDYILQQSEKVGKLASAFAPITNWAMRTKWISENYGRSYEDSCRRKFPEYHFKNFRRIYHKKRPIRNEKLPILVVVRPCTMNPM